MKEENYIPKLSKAPLREVIFELKWLFGLNEQKSIEDVGYPLAIGRFHDKIIAQTAQKKYVEKASILPDKHLPHMVEHQFWKEEEGRLPVVQFGSGILAVNDSGETYVWEESYLPLILDVLSILKESYSTKKSIDQVSLQYINVVEIPKDANVQEFVKNTIQIETITHYDLPFEAAGVNGRLTREYLLEDGSVLNMTFSIFSDSKYEKLYLMFKNTITNISLQKLSEIPEWLEKAHNKTSSLFRTMVNPPYYDTFK